MITCSVPSGTLDDLAGMDSSKNGCAEARGEPITEIKINANSIAFIYFQSDSRQFKQSTALSNNVPI